MHAVSERAPAGTACTWCDTGAVRVSFADFVLDTTTFELRRDGVPVPMEPKVFDVLAYLVRHRDRVMRKTELLDAVWGDRFVSDSALTSRIKRVRQALGSMAWSPGCHFPAAAEIGSLSARSAAEWSSLG
jgi:DNA-binding response OmpR family regulator